MPLTASRKVGDTKSSYSYCVQPTHRPRRSQSPLLPTPLHLLTLLIRTPRSRSCPPAAHASPSPSFSTLLATNSLQVDQVVELRAPSSKDYHPVRTYTEQLTIPTSCPCSSLCLCPKGEASPHSLRLQSYIPRCLLPVWRCLSDPQSTWSAQAWAVIHSL